ncbi:MAG TPA: Holliday junction branch migration protein RuvA [Aggregatilinea sp.]|jgi:Holliday junction DNA helicase RuvA|uniref:Holliday junction branch migration protein RuvA n=1 Tax=Aggregatilinea sp. TaxID=2806333 RepID=UPI002BAC5A46|nr:Holliday junction branch migration protein RuvA [Aggregatilinea sp.]HML22245.1 Holliday junction branch migration protein RuvA [Aggregatilinea sp.]
MIDILTGQVAVLGDDYVVMMVGGVGLRVHVPKTIFDTVSGRGQAITLFTHLVVREDALVLYGFADEEERSLFETLLTVSGVGPRLAVSILGALSVEHLHNAVASESPEVLTRVPGIGKKMAQKLVFELKDKLKTDLPIGLSAISDVDTDVLATLTALGYSVVEAQSALQSIPRDAPQDVEERVRIALEYFA